jgi:hypothetical protein
MAGFEFLARYSWVFVPQASSLTLGAAYRCRPHCRPPAEWQTASREFVFNLFQFIT